MTFKVTATCQDTHMPALHADTSDKENARVLAISFSRQWAGLRAITILDTQTGDKVVYNGLGEYLWTLPGTLFKEKVA